MLEDETGTLKIRTAQKKKKKKLHDKRTGMEWAQNMT